jgi:hypothetical protein
MIYLFKHIAAGGEIKVVYKDGREKVLAILELEQMVAENKAAA